MIYAETQRGESSLRWWGAPLESISAERRSAGWSAIRLHHSSCLYCLPICEWQESRRHLYAYNLTCCMKQESRRSACLGVFISLSTELTVEGIFLSTGGTERFSEHTTDFQCHSPSNLLCANKGLATGTEEEDLNILTLFKLRHLYTLNIHQEWQCLLQFTGIK